MKNRINYLRKNSWMIYLMFYVVIFLIMRLQKTFDSKTVIEIYTNMFYEKKAMGIYVLGYLLLLGPLFKKWLNYMYVIKSGTKERHMQMLTKLFLIRAVSYSFVLNIVLYCILGTTANDYFLTANIIRTLLQFLSQSVCWLFISFLCLFMKLCFRQMLAALSISYLCLIFLCLSNYVNCYEKLEYYIRLYYLMFHIEQYPSWSVFFGVTLFYGAIAMLMYLISYKQLQKKEYY